MSTKAERRPMTNLKSGMMTPEAQRITLAELAGWKPTKQSSWDKQHSKRQFWTSPSGLRRAYPPDLLDDLNAVHELEKALSKPQRVDYTNILGKICGTQQEKIFATAQQRCEALLKALGKWTEGESAPQNDSALSAVPAPGLV